MLVKAKSFICSASTCAHPSFAKNVRTWLRNVVIDHKDFLTPFHLPVCTVVAGKSPAIENTMESKLYFNSNCIRKLSWHHCAACHCVQLRQQHPELRTTSIHGLILLRKPSSCMFPVGCNLAVLHCNRTSVSRL